MGHERNGCAGRPGWSGGGIGRVWYGSGGAQQDVLRAELEADRLRDGAINLIRQKRIAQAGLAAIVQQPISLLPEAQQEIAMPEVPPRSRSVDRLGRTIESGASNAGVENGSVPGP